MRRAWWVVLFAVGCGGPAVNDSGEVSRLYGAVQVRQFEGGAHPGALVMAKPVPATDGRDGSLFPEPTTASDRAGPCTLLVPSTTCAPPCGADDPLLIDGGPIHVRGGQVAAALDLVFDPRQGVYAPIAPFDPGSAIFSGGETLEIFSDGSVAPPFSGKVRAPEPLVVTAPEVLSMDGSPLVVSWTPGSGDTVQIDLVASNYHYEWARIHCEAADGDGSLTVPDALLAELPRKPRDLTLEVSRDQIERARSSEAGAGVLLSAGWEVVVVGHDW